jgi:isoquinoline 1-oxidoreductase subunit alpha
MIKLKVNGKSQQFDGDPEMPLLWVLRDELDLKGTKFGCDRGLCSACTIHLNGCPFSCVLDARVSSGK